MKYLWLVTLITLAHAGPTPHPGDTVHFDGKSSTELAMTLMQGADFLESREAVVDYVR